MTLKHVLKFFSKNSEDLLFPRPLREREELLSEQSELSNSGEGCVSCAKHTETDLSSNRLNVLTTFKKAAFTLAEVLITLAIIGVVAAMTLPTLIQNYQKQTYVTGLKKAYANLQNAFAKMAYDEGVTDWRQTFCFGHQGSEECIDRLKKQFNVVKSGTFFGDLLLLTCDLTYYEFYTSDGMRYANVSENYASLIFVDVNGDKGPNKPGRDRFVFDVYYGAGQIKPAGIFSNYQTYCTTANVNSNSRDAMYYCAAKVLTEGKMDY